MTQLYGFDRETVDLDVLTVVSANGSQATFDRARVGSELHRKRGIYLDVVTVVENYPDDYESRLTEMFPGKFKNIRLWGLEAHDLALTKLRRNNEKDREDVKHLAQTRRITAAQLLERYEKEMRPYVAIPEQQTDPIMKLWREMLHELDVG